MTLKAECRYSECRYADCRGIFYYAECHSAECRYAACRGATVKSSYECPKNKV
jgi:hypothetical protein